VTREALAEECARIVMETVPPVMRIIREETRRHGAPLFTIPQLRTLAFVHRRPGACLFELAEHLGVTRPTASSLVERLVKRDMLTRTPDPQERRRVLLTLTPLGLRHFRSARDSTRRWMAAVLTRISPDALQRIIVGVTLLREGFLGPTRSRRRPELETPHPAPPVRSGAPGVAVTLSSRKGESHA
jgi:DNA-binding MarR family transcriptional regulator